MNDYRYSFDEKLCREYLTREGDVTIIRDIAKQLPLISDILDGDVFIDCPTGNLDLAIVVAEATPHGKKPLYSECPVGKLAWRDNEPAALRTLYSGITGRDIRGTSQESFPIQQVTVPIWGSLPSPIGVLIREFGVNAEHTAERKLELIESASSGFTDAVYSLWSQNVNFSEVLSEAVLLFDKDGIVTYCNKEATKLYRRLGYREPLIGMNFGNVVLSEEQFHECIKKVYELKEITMGNLSLEVKFFRQEEKKGEDIGLCMIVHDVTGIKSKERQLRFQSFVINEMNHRIKNNLQMVASVLGIQSLTIDDKTVKQMFNESISRVLSIAAVHDALAISETEKIEIKPLIERICCNIANLTLLKYEINGTSIVISAEKASAFGLVINELVQNVVKHVQPPKNEDKRVVITIIPGNKYITVEISDNGTGFPESPIRGLGLQLVQRLVTEVLAGKIDINNGKRGSIICLTFVDQ
jgi:two-component sensor histidine kinase